MSSAGSNLPPVVGTRKTRGKDRTIVDNVYGSPVDIKEYSYRRIGCLFVLAIILLIVAWAIWRFNRDSTDHYEAIQEHFKYGSIGSEVGGSLSDAVGGLLPPERI